MRNYDPHDPGTPDPSTPAYKAAFQKYHSLAPTAGKLSAAKQVAALIRGEVYDPEDRSPLFIMGIRIWQSEPPDEIVFLRQQVESVAYSLSRDEDSPDYDYPTDLAVATIVTRLGGTS